MANLSQGNPAISRMGRKMVRTKRRTGLLSPVNRTFRPDLPVHRKMACNRLVHSFHTLKFPANRSSLNRFNGLFSRPFLHINHRQATDRRRSAPLHHHRLHPSQPHLTTSL